MIRRRQQEDNMAFLDIICCGFGAIVLLMMLVKTGSPAQETALEQSPIDKSAQVRELQQQLFAIRGEISDYQRQLNARQEQLSKWRQRIAILKIEEQQLALQFASTNNAAAEQEAEKTELKVALQRLNDIMKRLQRSQQNNYIGGVPVDSEYIIFIIDTSGSMVTVAWQRMLREVENILKIYPRVKGIQVMNDMGQFMFESYRNKWIPDSPKRRKLIRSTLQNWHPFSNSSPVEGITAAIKTYYAPNRKISLYVLGDDFNGNINGVLKTVAKLNKKTSSGESLVRIHTIGFPVQYSQTKSINTHYSALMRQLAENNNGAFVGLNSNR